MSLKLIYFVIHGCLFFFLYYNNLIMLHINDDLALYWLLKAGYSGTLILSYPVSLILVNLYQLFPSVQWLSSFYFLLTILNIAIFYLYIIENIEDKLSKILLILLSVFLYIYFWENVSVTILTLLTYVSAVSVYRYNTKITFFLIVIALLLRTDIAILCLPFVVLSLFFINNSRTVEWKTLLLGSIIIILTIWINFYLIKNDSLYYNWTQFNGARAFFSDLKANMEITNFTLEQKRMLDEWWVQDESLLPNGQVISQKYSLSILYLEKILDFDISNLITNKFRFILLFLFGFGLFVFYKYYRNYLFGYIIFFMGILLVLILRNVDRVIIPLLFLWFILLFELSKNNKIVIKFFILGFIFFIVSLKIVYLKISTENLELKKEQMYLLNSLNMKCEFSISLPQDISRKNKLLDYNFLFDEYNWIDVKNNILPSGWISRHPYFYESHNITYFNNQRKYKDYYNWLLSDESCFCGGEINKDIDSFLAMYDSKITDKSCKHKIKVITEIESLKITKIYLDCEKLNDITNN